MIRTSNRRGFLWRCAAVPAAFAVGTLLAAAAQAQEPIKIGFSMALTGPLAGAGAPALLAMKIWEDDVNKKGGLLGRKVQLVYFDDKSNPAEVPGIYTKLLDVDKVDIIMGPYASTQIAPAMPIAIQRNKLLISLFGTGINDNFKYNRYFSMIPTGPNPKPSFTKGFFEIAAAQNPKPQTVAIAAADAEFGRNVQEGARENAKAAGLKIVYDRNYPPTTTDFAPIVRAIQATNPDIVVICSYPLDSVGMVRAINEIGFKPKLIGGGMVGLQFTAIKQQLGPLLNGFVNYETWLPVKSMQYPGVLDLVAKYQERAKGEKVDPLGYYLPPWSYAYLQVLEQAVNATKSLDDEKLADYIRNNTIKTVIGDVKFGPIGEWTESRFLQVQFQNISGNDMKEFTDMSKQPVLAPANLKTGEVIYPFEKARK
ncbi:MAG: amino acid ABC transporter substrate-binding protein [Bradyrhizobiaceae bacterium]|nr:amino acid ABC transporter substrate-binding protein [Bradyrhizobiaceae bacterium]